MFIINNVLSILEKSGLTQMDLCRAIGVKSSTVTNWKTRNTDPPAKYIIPICEFLSVTPEYLLTGNEAHQNVKSEIKAEQGQAMSDISKELLEVFQSLPMRERVKLLNVAYDFEERYRNSGSSSSSQSAKLPTPNNPLVSQNEQKLLDVFQNFTETEQVKIIGRIEEWLEVKRRRESANKQQLLQSSPQSSPYPTEPPVLNEQLPQSRPVQAQWRITAHRTDGVYESCFATPEEVEKLRILLENPDPEEPEY